MLPFDRRSAESFISFSLQKTVLAVQCLVWTFVRRFSGLRSSQEPLETSTLGGGVGRRVGKALCQAAMRGQEKLQTLWARSLGLHAPTERWTSGTWCLTADMAPHLLIALLCAALPGYFTQGDGYLNCK